MKNSNSFCELMASIEPSYEPCGEWEGWFRIGEWSGRVSIEPDQWIVVSAPAGGSAEDLLRRQARITSHAKIVAGGLLRAETPFENHKGIAQIFTSARAAVEQGLATIGEGPLTIATSVPEEAETIDKLREALAGKFDDWSQSERDFLIRLDRIDLMSRLKASVEAGCVRFRSDLGRAPEGEPAVGALIHFLLELNSHLRLARAGIVEDRVVLEVALRSCDLRSAIVERAIGALIAGTRLAKRECAALSQPGVAQLYREFIEERGRSEWLH